MAVFCINLDIMEWEITICLTAKDLIYGRMDMTKP